MSKSTLDESWIVRRLESASNTQESIQSLSAWALSHKVHHEKIVAIWLQVLKSVKLEQRLVLFYLCNDVVQTCKKRHAIVYKDAFREVLNEAATLVTDASVRPNVERLFKIWEERGVYDKDFVALLISTLNEKTQKLGADAVTELLNNFKPLVLFESLAEFARKEEALERQRSEMRVVALDEREVDRQKKPLKSKHDSSDYVDSVALLRSEMHDYMAALVGEKTARLALVENLEQAQLFYDEQNREANIVINAYRAFGARINTMRRRLEDKRELLPDPPKQSPIKINTQSIDRTKDQRLMQATESEATIHHAAASYSAERPASYIPEHHLNLPQSLQATAASYAPPPTGYHGLPPTSFQPPAAEREESGGETPVMDEDEDDALAAPAAAKLNPMEFLSSLISKTQKPSDDVVETMAPPTINMANFWQSLQLPPDIVSAVAAAVQNPVVVDSSGWAAQAAANSWALGTQLSGAAEASSWAHAPAAAAPSSWAQLKQQQASVATPSPPPPPPAEQLPPPPPSSHAEEPKLNWMEKSMKRRREDRMAKKQSHGTSASESKKEDARSYEKDDEDKYAARRKSREDSDSKRKREDSIGESSSKGTHRRSNDWMEEPKSSDRDDRYARDKRPSQDDRAERSERHSREERHSKDYIKADRHTKDDVLARDESAARDHRSQTDYKPLKADKYAWDERSSRDDRSRSPSSHGVSLDRNESSSDKTHKHLETGGAVEMPTGAPVQLQMNQLRLPPGGLAEGENVYVEDPSLVSTTPYYAVIDGQTYLIQPATDSYQPPAAASASFASNASHSSSSTGQLQGSDSSLQLPNAASDVYGYPPASAQQSATLSQHFMHQQASLPQQQGTQQSAQYQTQPPPSQVAMPHMQTHIPPNQLAAQQLAAVMSQQQHAALMQHQAAMTAMQQHQISASQQQTAAPMQHFAFANRQTMPVVSSGISGASHRFSLPPPLPPPMPSLPPPMPSLPPPPPALHPGTAPNLQPPQMPTSMPALLSVLRQMLPNVQWPQQATRLLSPAMFRSTRPSQADVQMPRFQAQAEVQSMPRYPQVRPVASFPRSSGWVPRPSSHQNPNLTPIRLVDSESPQIVALRGRNSEGQMQNEQNGGAVTRNIDVRVGEQSSVTSSGPPQLCLETENPPDVASSDDRPPDLRAFDMSERNHQAAMNLREKAKMLGLDSLTPLKSPTGITSDSAMRQRSVSVGENRSEQSGGSCGDAGIGFSDSRRNIFDAVVSRPSGSLAGAGMAITPLGSSAGGPWGNTGSKSTNRAIVRPLNREMESCSTTLVEGGKTAEEMGGKSGDNGEAYDEEFDYSDETYTSPLEVTSNRMAMYQPAMRARGRMSIGPMGGPRQRMMNLGDYSKGGMMAEENFLRPRVPGLFAEHRMRGPWMRPEEARFRGRMNVRGGFRPY